MKIKNVSEIQVSLGINFWFLEKGEIFNVLNHKIDMVIENAMFRESKCQRLIHKEIERVRSLLKNVNDI